MRKLHTVTALIEGTTGLALLSEPSGVVQLLLGSPLTSAVDVTLARVAGAALFALGIACWQAHDDTQNRAGRGLVVAMLSYNLTVGALLAYAALGLDLHGLALRPAIVLHAAMAGWCVVCLQSKPWVRASVAST